MKKIMLLCTLALGIQTPSLQASSHPYLYNGSKIVLGILNLYVATCCTSIAEIARNANTYGELVRLFTPDASRGYILMKYDTATTISTVSGLALVAHGISGIIQAAKKNKTA